MKNLSLFLILVLTAFVLIESGCKKKKEEEPAPSASTGTPTTPGTPTLSTVTTTIGIGSLTFQDTTTTLAGGCVNTTYGYLMAATDSTNSLGILFYPSKPASSQSIDLATVVLSPRMTITSGTDMWMATSGTLAITVIQGYVAVYFSNATFTNYASGATALASGSIICQ